MEEYESGKWDLTLATGDMLMEKNVLCAVRYSKGYGTHAYLHECMTCDLYRKNTIINGFIFFTIYIKNLFKCLFRK